MFSIQPLIEAIRLPGDEVCGGVAQPASLAAEADLLFGSLLVQETLTPGLAAQVARVAVRVGLALECIRVFVYASPYLQAECRSDAQNQAILRLSSALMETLSEDELDFVIGHEIGHFLLGHTAESRVVDSGCLEEALISRRRELSADRVGLIACGGLASALSAMIKTVSGLSQRHLRFDIAGFIGQLREVDTRLAAVGGMTNSHPAFRIRCRALLWFSLAFDDGTEPMPPPRDRIEEANRRVLTDLAKYVDQPVTAAIESAFKELEFWTATVSIVQAGTFSKIDQRRLAERHGSDMVERLKGLLAGLSAEEALTECRARVDAAGEALRRMAPRAYAKSMERPPLRSHVSESDEFGFW